MSAISSGGRSSLIDLLPDREAATVEAWLADHPAIEIVSRDRGRWYGQAIGQALPQAMQVADRWHLLENASRAFADVVRRSISGASSAPGRSRRT